MPKRTVLITGASTGIGAAAARAFAALGDNLALNYLSSDDAARAVLEDVRAAGADAILVKADASSRRDVERTVAAATKRFGRIDVLINNAGGAIARRPLEQISDEEFERVLAINFRSVFLFCQTVAPIMKAQGGGRIINVSSIAASNGGGVGVAHYAASKAAVEAFSKNIAKELVGHNITVNCVAPGIIQTPFHEKVSTPEVFQALVSGIPMGRPGSAEEVARWMVFMASDECAYATGQVFHVNGGLLMP